MHNKNNKTICFYSSKGGVGKTTCCANIAAAMGKMNLKVLLIDLDPISTLTTYLNLENKNNALNLFKKDVINKKIITKNINHVDIITSSIDLGFNLENMGDFQELKENFIKNIDSMKNDYDFIFIDMTSGWSNLNKIIFSYTNSIILTLVCDQFSLDSINNTFTILNKVKSELNPSIKIEGVIINKFDKRQSNSITYLSEFNAIFKDCLYENIIPQDINITKLQKENKLVVNASPWANSAIKFCDLANEIYKKVIL